MGPRSMPFFVDPAQCRYLFLDRASGPWGEHVGLSRGAFGVGLCE